MPVWVMTRAEGLRAAEDVLLAEGVVVLRVPDGAGRPDISAVLRLIAGRGMSRLMVEGGPTLVAAFLAADIVDEAVLFRSPKVVGADGIDALAGLPLTALTQSPRLTRVRSEAVGADRCDVFERK